MKKDYRRPWGSIAGGAFAFAGGIATADAQEAPAGPMSMPLSMPAMAGPLAANPHPMKWGAGPLGDIYVTGVVSGLVQWQDAIFPGDRDFHWDLSNGQVFI